MNPAFLVRLLCATTVTFCLIAGSAEAQTNVDEPNGELNYRLVPNADGVLELVRTDQAGLSSDALRKAVEDAVSASSPATDYVVVEGADGTTFAFPADAKADVDPGGMVLGQVGERDVKVVSKDDLPADAFVVTASGAGLRENIRKLKRGEVEGVINDMVSTAQRRFCTMRARPNEVTITADVRIGAVAEGGIAFAATWEMEKLCATLTQ